MKYEEEDETVKVN